MTFNSCKHCGLIKETATIKLNKLKKIITQKRYVYEHGYFEEKLREQVTSHDLWEWENKITEVLKEL